MAGVGVGFVRGLRLNPKPQTLFGFGKFCSPEPQAIRDPVGFQQGLLKGFRLWGSGFLGFRFSGSGSCGFVFSSFRTLCNLALVQTIHILNS